MPSTITDRRDGLTTSVAIKAPCAAVASSNVTLAGEQTIGSVALESGDRVLLIGQTEPSENGIYVVDTGDWTRARDFDGALDVVAGTLVLVRNQFVEGSFYEVTSDDPITLGTDEIEFRLHDNPNIRYDQTQDEIDGALTPVDYGYPPGGDIRRFTTATDGSADITSVLEDVNAVYSNILFAPGTTINCTNWVPLEGTKITAYGARTRRHGNALYSATGSSAAVVIANDDVEILGGAWTDGPSATQADFSGAILIDGGSNFRISHAEIHDTWGGIFGNEERNGTNLAEGVTVTACWFHDNQHNNYFADIDGLIFNGNLSELSVRDGLRTFRNVRNITVTGNILRNNGDGTVGQSQDGIDIFIAGYRCIITGNLIYGNSVKGVDIKRNADFASETFEDSEIVIAGNIIFDNDNIGISVDVADAVGYVDYVNMYGNLVTDNGARGIYCTFLRYSSINNNTVYRNAGDGMRIESSLDTNVLGNVVVDNTGVGISNVSSTSYCEHNRVVGSANQTTGIVVSGGVCRNNYVSGHTTNFNLTGTLPARGKIISVPFARVTTVQLLAIAEACAISGYEMATNIAEAAMDVTLSKRNATTGAFSANIASNLAVAFATAFVAVSQTITGSNSQRNLAGGEMLTLTLANITTNTWTAGMLKIHYVD